MKKYYVIKCLLFPKDRYISKGAINTSFTTEDVRIANKYPSKGAALEWLETADRAYQHDEYFSIFPVYIKF